jgi:aspartokinase-like uncharacterized kinase
MVDIVVKFGGAVLAHPAVLDRALDSIANRARACRLVIVPGGGPFAEAVREADRRLAVSESAAHWMATLAMDQYAHLLVSRLPGAALVTTAREIDGALDAAQVPILAPFRWLRQADPLPHSWNVTSDSIAAWIAGELGARRLVLVKPTPDRGRADRGLVDAYFPKALPAHVRSIIVAADDVAAIEGALASSARQSGS